MIRDAQAGDVAAIAALAGERRTAYEAAQPQFWRRAADDVAVHTPWLAALVADPAALTLVAVSDDGSVAGYLVATLAPTPPVYDLASEWYVAPLAPDEPDVDS